MQSNTKIIPLLFLGASMFTHGQGPATPMAVVQPDAIQSYLQPLVNDHTFAGAVTLVATRDRTVYLRPIGFRDFSAKTPMPADALFWIASTSDRKSTRLNSSPLGK